MLCSQEANITPWMLVIKQCDMDNCYALSLFRQVFFLLNKPSKGLKNNHSQLSAHKFFPSYLSFDHTLQSAPVFTPVWFPVHWTKWQSIMRWYDIQGMLRSLIWQGCWAMWQGSAERFASRDRSQIVNGLICSGVDSIFEHQEACEGVWWFLFQRNDSGDSMDSMPMKRKKIRDQQIRWDCHGPAEKWWRPN